MKKGFVVSLMAALGWAGSMATAAQTQVNVEWAGQSLRDVVYKQVAGRELQMDIYFPSAQKPEMAPVIYFVHGGGWAAGNKEKFGQRNVLAVGRKLADAGFVCVSVDYRLCRAGGNVVMRDCVTDAMDGLRFLKKNAARYGIDSSRIVVFGESAGGHIAQMLTLAAPDGFKGDPALAGYRPQPLAGISWYGPTDFTDVNLFKTDLSDKDPNRFGDRITGGKGDYTTNPKAYEEMSPIFWIKKDAPPLLLMQGDTDATIPFAHAPHMKKRADEIGADVEMVIVKHAGHNWRKAGGEIQPGLKEIHQITADFALKQIQSAKRVK